MRNKDAHYTRAGKATAGGTGNEEILNLEKFADSYLSRIVNNLQSGCYRLHIQGESK